MNFKVSKKNVGNMDNQNICMINRFSLKNCDSYLRKKDFSNKNNTIILILGIHCKMLEIRLKYERKKLRIKFNFVY